MAGNEDQIKYWNGAAGQTWTQAQERLDRLLAPLTGPAIERSAAAQDDRVLDIGCGCGATTLALLERGAAVCGVDISAPMLERARERTQAYENVAFLEADAAIQPFTADHSLVFSRFGVMFFIDSVAAFTNIRSGLAKGGRMVFLCWQAPAKNPWIYVAGKAIQPHLPEPAQPPDPKAPGPFAFADPDYVSGVLREAGFVDVQLDAIHADLHIADDLDDAIDFQGKIGPVARALAELDGDARARALDAAREALSEHMTAAGLTLGATAWLVTAAV